MLLSLELLLVVVSWCFLCCSKAKKTSTKLRLKSAQLTSTKLRVPGQNNRRKLRPNFGLHPRTQAEVSTKLRRKFGLLSPAK